MCNLTHTADWQSLASDELSYNTVTIQTSTPRGVCYPHTFEFLGCSAPYDTRLSSTIDEMVSRDLIPDIQSACPLINEAILVRGYLSLLFPSSPATEFERIWRGECVAERHHVGNKLSLHLVDFTLARLDDLTWHILDAVREANQSDDNNYCLDVSAAAGILYTGLRYVVEGLTRGMLRPLYGGDELSGVIVHRCSSVADELLHHQRRNCPKFKNWAERIPGPLEELRSIFSIHNMKLIYEKHPHSTNTYSHPSSFSEQYPVQPSLQVTTGPSPNLSISSTCGSTNGYSRSPDSGYLSVPEAEESLQYHNNVTWSQN